MNLEERAERARRGSRRKRDVDALAELERRERAVPDDVAAGELANVWAEARAMLEDAFRFSGAFELWIKPLELVGARKGAVVLEAPAPVRAWVERRYARALGDACRAAGASGAFVYLPRSTTGEDVPF